MDGWRVRGKMIAVISISAAVWSHIAGLKKNQFVHEKRTELWHLTTRKAVVSTGNIPYLNATFNRILLPWLNH